MTEPRKPGRPRKEPTINSELIVGPPPVDAVEPIKPSPVPPGPLVLEVRLGPPGQGKIIFSQRVYAHTIDQQTHQAVITGVLRPTSEI